MFLSVIDTVAILIRVKVIVVIWVTETVVVTIIVRNTQDVLFVTIVDAIIVTISKRDTSRRFITIVYPVVVNIWVCIVGVIGVVKAIIVTVHQSPTLWGFLIPIFYPVVITVRV